MLSKGRYPTRWFQIAPSSEVAPCEIKLLHYFGEEVILRRSEQSAVHSLMIAFAGENAESVLTADVPPARRTQPDEISHGRFGYAGGDVMSGNRYGGGSR